MNYHKLSDANELDCSLLENPRIDNLGSIEELLRYHRRGQWFKSTIAHHSISSLY